MVLDTLDPIEAIPDPDTLRVMLADAVRRSDLLRELIKVASRKQSYKPRGKVGSTTNATPLLIPTTRNRRPPMPADPSAATVPHVHPDATEVFAVPESEAARLCGVSGKTLKRLADRGEDVGRVRIGCKVVYVLDRLRAWLSKQAEMQMADVTVTN